MKSKEEATGLKVSHEENGDIQIWFPKQSRPVTVKKEVCKFSAKMLREVAEVLEDHEDWIEEEGNFGNIAMG